MRFPTMLLLIPAMAMLIIAAANADDNAPALVDFGADIRVTVMVGSALLEGAVVKLDLNNNGIWEEHLGEPQAVTVGGGLADFGTIVSIQDPGGDDSADIIDWQPARIMTGNLRGTVGARDVQFDFVLPAGVGRASLGLYDLRGRRLAESDGLGDLDLNVPGSLPSGVYFVRLGAGPAGAVTHRITSVGQQAQTIRARQVSVAEAVAAGWMGSRTPAGKQQGRDEGHPMTIMISHAGYGGMNQEVVVVPELNEFNVVIPESPAGHVHIPPGKFKMGSPTDEPGRFSDETQHEVTLTQGFYMSRYEVTQELWYEVMGGIPSTSQLPRDAVTWDLAVQFCNALSLQEGLTPAYTIHGNHGNVTWNQGANGYRLPTEAEWEHACRAGSTAAFASGPISHLDCTPLDANLDATGWYCGNRLLEEGPAWVGRKQANGWGLYDMHGNLSEWVWCGMRTYTSGPQQDPVTSPDTYADRVLRGGHWYTVARFCRSARRSYASPYHPALGLGVRPVRSAF